MSILEALGATISISLVPICVRAVEADAIAIGIIRLITAISVLGFFFFMRNSFPKLTKKQWLILALIGTLFGGHWLTYFVAIKLSSASIAVIGLSTYGIHLVVLNWVVNKKRPSLTNFISILIAIIGSYIVIPEFSLKNEYTVGLLFGILSGFVYAFVPILHKQHQDIPGSLRTLAQFSFALLFFTCMAPFGQWNVPASDWPILIFMGVVCTLIGHVLWVKATTALPIKVTSCIFYTGLPFTLFFERVLLDKEIALVTLCGAAMIIVANLLNIEWRRPTSG
jgi:drug/metabolite transporter (DMT)-like permease